AKSKEIYLNYFEPSNPFHKSVEKAIQDELPLYRFFKIYMVGSSEKSEVAKKTGNYLEALKPFEGVDSEEERLARAMYLAYWEAKLNNKDFSEELIMNSQLFNDFFGEYQNRIADAFGNYVQDLAAYLFGIDIQLEGIPNELESLRKSIISNYEYTPVYNGEELETIKLITDNQEVVETISSIIKDAETSASDYDPETLIMRTRSSIFRSSFSLIAGLKSVISEEFVVVTPKQVNLGWIRWVVYVVFLLVWYMLFKNFKLPLTLIIASETVYIGAFFNIQSTVDGMIYGIVFAISILFSLSYFLLKKKYVPALFSLFAIVSLFLPSFATEDLLMKNEFSNSLFYPVLLEETLNDPLGKVQNSLKEYDSLINESIQSFSTVVNDVFQGEFYEIPEEYFVPENFSKRIEYVNGLKSTHKDFAKELDNFVYYENSRAKKAEKQIQSIEKLFTKFASIASDSFKDEMVAFVNSRFSGKTLERLLSTLNSAKRSSVVWVPGYKVGTFLSAIMLLGFALFLSALNMYEAFIPMLGSFAVSVLTLLRNQTLFVQVGVPSLTIYVNWYIPYALILSIGFGLYWLYHNHILKRRSRV
ncbi:MAG TPA: hypothetical protein PLC31_05325, partial [Fervidobacterium sp.]|nr:hypothetical protein [Fervidobacterium sp.]